MKKRTLKRVATVIEKRTEKRKEQLKKLEDKRQSQWQDELLKAAVSALPRSTPKMIEDRMQEIKDHHPADAPAAEAALDAIGLLKENLNGSHPEVLTSDPFQLLWAETLDACSRQTSKWKLLPITLLHPFTPRVAVMSAITGKKISRNDMAQMQKAAQTIKDSLDRVYSTVTNDNGEVATEKDLLNKLREMYPTVLITKDEAAINSILDSSTTTRTAAELPDWALGTGYTDSDGEPDGYVLDLEDVNTDLTTDNNDDDDDDDEDKDDDGTNIQMDNNRDDNNAIDNSIETMEALSIADDSKSIATPVDDFTSSLSDSLIQSVLGSNANKNYHAMPPPTRPMGLYAAVPPMESSPKKTTTTPTTPSELSRQDPKRQASPMQTGIQQPRKLIKVEAAEAEVRQLRQQLEESNRKVASLGQCIGDMQMTMQNERWMQHQQTMRLTRESTHTGVHMDNLPELSRRQQHQRQQHQQQLRQSRQSRPRQPPIPNTPRPSRRRARTNPEYGIQIPTDISPIRYQTLSGGPRTSAAERTRRLISREALGGMIPGPVIHESHRALSRRSYDRK